MEPMLEELKGRFSTPSSSPYDTVQELQQTIAALQQIKSGLEETEEYRAAQAEKERAKEDRVLQLKKRVEESKAAVEKMLGYSLKSEQFSTGEAYGLMPVGFHSCAHFEDTIKHYQTRIATLEAELVVMKEPGYKPRGIRPEYALEQTQRNIDTAEYTRRKLSSQLIGYMMAYQPMKDLTFCQTLATHLDAMLEAYLALRTLECAEAKASV
jgi:predicted RNase H-like nuclease (RuvC/YqgF family)